MSRQSALKRFRRLRPESRVAALAAIPGYLAACRGENRKVCDLATFLGERRFEAFAAAASGAAVGLGEGERSAKVFIRRGSPAWDAWAAYRGGRIASFESTEHKAEGRYEATPFPPGHQGGDADRGVVVDFSKSRPDRWGSNARDFSEINLRLSGNGR